MNQLLYMALGAFLYSKYQSGAIALPTSAPASSSGTISTGNAQVGPQGGSLSPSVASLSQWVSQASGGAL